MTTKVHISGYFLKFLSKQREGKKSIKVEEQKSRFYKNYFATRKHRNKNTEKGKFIDLKNFLLKTRSNERNFWKKQS